MAWKGWQEALASTDDLMTPAAVQASAAALNKARSSTPMSKMDRGIQSIRNFVSDNPSETRNQGFNALDIGTEIRNAYMDQRGSGLPWVNEGMNISDFLGSPQAFNIAAQYGNVLDPGQAYEEWIRSQTVPGTVDTRNQYQLEMNQLRNQYPEAYASEFPLPDAMMKGLPAIAKLALGKVTGGASSILSAMGDSELGRQSTAMMQSFNPLSDDDEDDIPWWQFWNKANGGLASLNGGGSYWTSSDDPVVSSTPTSTRPTMGDIAGPATTSSGSANILKDLENLLNTNTPSVPVNPVNPYLGGTHDQDYDWSTPDPMDQVGAEGLQAALSMAAAGISNVGGRPAGPGKFDLTNTLGVPVPGLTEGTPDEVFTFDESGLVGDTPPPVDTGGPPPSLVSQPTHTGGTSYTGAPLFGEDAIFEPPPGESPFKEQGQRQFDTQFMASQLLHDLSRGKFDQGGLANMSENALGEFDTAKSKWKWKYDEQVRGLMDKGFSLKEAIDEIYNKYKMMPYKGFSMGAA